MPSLRRLAVGAAIAVPALALFAWAMRPGGSTEALPVLWRAPDFALVDQAGDTLRTSDLRGTTWVTSFIFTNCASVCPLITARMAEVRDRLAADGVLGTEVRLISITVDPARDTVAALARYAKRFGDSPPSDWAFLTGSPPEAVRAMIEEGFKVGAYLDPEAADTAANYQVTHGSRFELVDAEGRVRATYDATDPEAVERVLSDLRRVLP